jgi:hypothetical protein
MRLHGTLQGFQRVHRTSSDLMKRSRIHETRSDFRRLRGISEDCTGLQKSAWNFKRLDETSQLKSPLLPLAPSPPKKIDLKNSKKQTTIT